MKNFGTFRRYWLIGFTVTIILMICGFDSARREPNRFVNTPYTSRFYLKLSVSKPDTSVKLLPDPINCDAEKIAQIIAPARDETGKRSFVIDCNCKLDKRYKITKRIIFQGRSASGITVDFNGSIIHGGQPGTFNYNKDMIEVKSTSLDTFIDSKKIRLWQRPENVTIKNCHIVGSVRVWGMGKNGESEDIKESSRRESTISHHVQRIRNNAPKNIVFDNITIKGVGRNPFYLAPGVTYSKLINSEIKGESGKVGIYLDAESAYNTIENNFIHVRTSEDSWGNLPFVTNRGWPQVAIDGSSWNRIINNRFSELSNGGIYFYRNCGEGGTIRHTPPEHNTISRNNFYYKKYKGVKPAIYLSSRNYGTKEHILGHCKQDDGRPYGSSDSDKDFARYNVIMQNQFSKRKILKPVGGIVMLVDATLDDMIVTKNKSLNSPNYIYANNKIE